MIPVDWPGAVNAWQVRDGLWRMAKPEYLHAEGWAQIPARIVDLRTPEEHAMEVPETVDWVSAPVEDRAHTEFWARHVPYPAHPRHYQDTIDTFPHLVRTALNTVWDAWRHGGVVVNCSAGRDRTGMIIGMLLNRYDAPGGQADWEEQSTGYAQAVRGINNERLLSTHPHENYIPPAELEVDVAFRLAAFEKFLTDWTPDRITRFMGGH